MFHQSLPDLLAPDALAAGRTTLLADGFVVLPGLLSDHGVAELAREMDALIAEHTPDRGYLLLRDPAGFPIVMNRMDKISDFLFDLAREPHMIALASGLLGKPALSLHVEYFAKPATGSMPAPPHQDHAFYEAHFADELAVSFWIPLDDVDEDCAALEYAPSPMTLLPHRGSPAMDFDYELLDPPEVEYRVAPVPRGGCVAHHSYAIHRTQVNRSGRPRRAVVFNYRGSPYRAWIEAA